MRLKGNFITQQVDDTQFLVPVGGAFSGIARGNATAAFLINLLREDIDEAALVDRMCDRYDAPRAVIAADVAEALAALRGIGALEE